MSVFCLSDQKLLLCPSVFTNKQFSCFLWSEEKSNHFCSSCKTEEVRQTSNQFEWCLRHRRVFSQHKEIQACSQISYKDKKETSCLVIDRMLVFCIWPLIKIKWKYYTSLPWMRICHPREELSSLLSREQRGISRRGRAVVFSLVERGWFPALSRNSR